MATMSSRRDSDDSIIVRYWSETEPPWDRRDIPWIVRLAVRWGITMVGFLVAEAIVTGIEIDGVDALLPAAAIFVVARALLRPLLLFLTCPLQLITLGLFTFVINAAILAFTAWLCGQWDIAFDVDGFAAAFLGALVISVVSFVLSRFFRHNPVTPRLT